MSMLKPTSLSSSRSTREWQDADSRYFLHPFTDHKSLAEHGARIIHRAEGIYIWDTDGKKILDAMSGLWCVNVGYSQPALVEAATRQLNELPFYNAFFQSATPPAIRLAELLAEVSPPQFNHVFFANSGSESNDTIIRMVRRYWDVAGQPERRIILGRVNGYHGSTIAGASLGGIGVMHSQGGLPIPYIGHIDQPFWYGSDRKLSPEEFGLVAARWLEERILAIGPERMAAFIGEPIQGAGGVIIPPETYWPEIQRICDKYGILLISDEVICGFGRTGHWFGCERFGFKPDLMSFAKGVTSGYIPLAGVLMSDRVANMLIDKGGEFAHGYTYSGHPVACAVGIANIELIREQNLVERVRTDVGPYFAEGFEQLRDHPLVGEVQTCGLMGAVHLMQDKARGIPFSWRLEVGSLCRSHCFENGLVMRAVGDRMIVAPPLVITRAQIDDLINLTRKSLDLTLADAQNNGWL